MQLSCNFTITKSTTLTNDGFYCLLWHVLWWQLLPPESLHHMLFYASSLLWSHYGKLLTDLNVFLYIRYILYKCTKLSHHSDTAFAIISESILLHDHDTNTYGPTLHGIHFSQFIPIKHLFELNAHHQCVNAHYQCHCGGKYFKYLHMSVAHRTCSPLHVVINSCVCA